MIVRAGFKRSGSKKKKSSWITADIGQDTKVEGIDADMEVQLIQQESSQRSEKNMSIRMDLSLSKWWQCWFHWSHAPMRGSRPLLYLDACYATPNVSPPTHAASPVAVSSLWSLACALPALAWIKQRRRGSPFVHRDVLVAWNSPNVCKYHTFVVWASFSKNV